MTGRGCGTFAASSAGAGDMDSQRDEVAKLRRFLGVELRRRRKQDGDFLSLRGFYLRVRLWPSWRTPGLAWDPQNLPRPSNGTDELYKFEEHFTLSCAKIARGFQKIVFGQTEANWTPQGLHQDPQFPHACRSSPSSWEVRRIFSSHLGMVLCCFPPDAEVNFPSCRYVSTSSD